MPKKRISFKHRFEYTVFMAFVMWIKISPWFLVRFTQRLLRLLLGKLSKNPSGILGKNLRRAFPNLGEEEIAGLTAGIARHFSRVLVEMIAIYVKKRPGKMFEKIEVLHLDFLERALEKKKGIVLFSGHFGNWELIPFILSRELDRKIHSVARKMDNPLVEKKVKQFREYMGSEVIDKTNSIRPIIRRLEKNGIIYLLIDQNTIEREGVFVDFFGVKASTVPTVSKLHLKWEVPIIPVFLHYEPNKIVLELSEEIHAAGTGSGKETRTGTGTVIGTGKETGTGTGKCSGDVVELTQRCTSLIEEKIRQYPEQWFWFHNRWKTKPPSAGAQE